jgi:hypothetical protein
MTRAAEWLPDPSGRHDHRYWDGARWTEHIADAGVAGTDPVDASLLLPPADPDATEPLDSLGLVPLGPVPEHLLPAEDAAPPSGRRHHRSRRRRRRRVALVAVVLLVLVAVAVALLARASDDDGDGKSAPPPVALTKAVARSLPSLPEAKATCVASFLQERFGPTAVEQPEQAAQLAGPDIDAVVRQGVDPCDRPALRKAVDATTAAPGGTPSAGAAGSPGADGGAVTTSTTSQPPLDDQEFADQLAGQYAASYGLPDAAARCVASHMVPTFRRGVDPQSQEGNEAFDQALAACGVTTTTRSATTSSTTSTVAAPEP